MRFRRAGGPESRLRTRRVEREGRAVASRSRPGARSRARRDREPVARQPAERPRLRCQRAQRQTQKEAAVGEGVPRRPQPGVADMAEADSGWGGRTLGLYAWIAHTQHRQGKTDSAIALLGEARDASLPVLGADHHEIHAVEEDLQRFRSEKGRDFR